MIVLAILSILFFILWFISLIPGSNPTAPYGGWAAFFACFFGFWAVGLFHVLFAHV